MLVTRGCSCCVIHWILSCIGWCLEVVHEWQVFAAMKVGDLVALEKFTGCCVEVTQLHLSHKERLVPCKFDHLGNSQVI